MIFLAIIAIIINSVSSFILGYNFCRNKNEGTLYFHESDRSMYLELEDIPNNGTITLKIQRV